MASSVAYPQAKRAVEKFEKYVSQELLPAASTGKAPKECPPIDSEQFSRIKDVISNLPSAPTAPQFFNPALVEELTGYRQRYAIALMEVAKKRPELSGYVQAIMRKAGVSSFSPSSAATNESNIHTVHPLDSAKQNRSSSTNHNFAFNSSNRQAQQELPLSPSRDGLITKMMRLVM